MKFEYFRISYTKRPEEHRKVFIHTEIGNESFGNLP